MGVRRLATVVVVAVAALLVPAVAGAHLERPSYWPDPAPDKTVSPPAGGKVPVRRSLASALDDAAPGRTRVVCQGRRGVESLRLLARSIRSARRHGYRLRPSQPRRRLSRRAAASLMWVNLLLARRCTYNEIQPAVTASGNNDRVVVLPGRYTEPTSRRAPLNDPRCAAMTQRDSSGAETPSYRYRVTCPNDQNLVHVAGRGVPDRPPPEPPLKNRQGIPDEGPCVRCNLQLEGTGVQPTDVIVDGASGYKSGHPEARPGTLDKHVILRADRADGFVVHNLTTRGALEHGIYVEEADGYRIDTVKMFWAADYGNLTFTSDHGLYTDCDGFGAGDAVLYPGAAPETGEQADKSFYKDAPRINTVVRRCDMRGSVQAYSGSMGNAVRITGNEIYGNSVGITTDTISAAGHPGYPADSVQIDHNRIYSNNLDLFQPDPPVQPVLGVLPVGTGVFWAGHNNGRVFANQIWDNWRAGVFLISIPDALVIPEGQVNPGVSCTNPQLTTSCGNRFFANRMGRVPPGFRPFKDLYAFGNKVGPARGAAPNGTDFWWDEGGIGATTGNCWYGNTGSDRTAAGITGPGVGDGDDTLPAHCATSVSKGDSPKVGYLLSCFLAREGKGPPEACDWYSVPPRPGTPRASAAQRRFARGVRRFLRTARAKQIRDAAVRHTAAAADRGVTPPSRARPLGQRLVGSVAQMASCRDWRRGGRARRLATLADVKAHVNLLDGAVRTPELPDREAYRILGSICAKPYAGGFRLYKLYARATSFAAFARRGT